MKVSLRGFDFSDFFMSMLSLNISIFRICSLRLTRLKVLKPLESELTSVIIAMKMQVRLAADLRIPVNIP